MTTSEQALRAARSASAQTTYLALNAENILLRDEISRLQAKFDIAHAALGVAVDECERLTGERDGAVKERDKWHRLAVESDRDVKRLSIGGDYHESSVGAWPVEFCRGCLENWPCSAAVISAPSELTAEVQRLDRELHLTRAELDETRGALERARDLAVRSGVFTREDDAHSEAQRSPWEGITP